MKKVLTGALAALTLVGAAAATVTPAAAQPWRGGYHGGYGGYRGGYGYRGGWGPGAAVGAGILGLAVGASLAHPAYGYGYGYGAPGPYYGGYGYYGCRTHLRWNPYWGGYERVRACY